MLPRRAMRIFGLDRNPLRRRIDRIEGWLAMLLAATFLFAGPIVAWQVGVARYHEALREARIAARDHVRVNAVLEEDAVLTYSGSDGSPLVQGPVRARWQGPDGSAHRGTVVPPQPGPAGMVVTVWVDAAGNRTRPPRKVGNIRLDGVITGVLVLVALGGVLAGARLAVRRTIIRRRLAWWEGEWTFVEPRWTNRR